MCFLCEEAFQQTSARILNPSSLNEVKMFKQLSTKEPLIIYQYYKTFLKVSQNFMNSVNKIKFY